MLSTDLFATDNPWNRFLAYSCVYDIDSHNMEFVQHSNNIIVKINYILLLIVYIKALITL